MFDMSLNTGIIAKIAHADWPVGVKVQAANQILDTALSCQSDCEAADAKHAREFGAEISLMGNLHTTEVMLKGTPDDVRRASKQAIDDAAEGGGFVLSTGDQCGRDTPEENILAMIEVARTYGKY